MSKLNNWFIEFDIENNTIIRLVSNEIGVGNNSYSDGNGIGYGCSGSYGYINGAGDWTDYRYSDIFGVTND